MEAAGRAVEAQGGTGVVHALAQVGLDLGELGREGRSHDRRLDNAEVGQRAVGQRQGQQGGALPGPRRAFQRRVGQQRPQPALIQGQRAIDARQDQARA